MMNFEVKPFDEYASITLNDLKDQTNSLLNLVTEEERPLRVTMKNGKALVQTDSVKPWSVVVHE